MQRFAVNAALMAALWLVLNGGDWSSWTVGAPTVLIGAMLATTLPPQPRFHLRWYGLAALLPYFLINSVKGAWDIGRRALQRDMGLKPALLAYPVSLPDELARVVLVDAITLLPGTLTVAAEGNTALVHVVDTDAAPLDDVRDLEERVGALFGRATEAAR